MKKQFVSVLGASVLALASSAALASSLTIDVLPGASFDQYLTVTPSANNKLVFSLSGLGSQFSALSFAFVGGGPTATGSLVAGGNMIAAFNDIRNSGYSLAAGTPYTVEVFGTAKGVFSGSVGKATVSVLNGTVAAVPEPESYAMLLAGLGIIGAVVRRRSL